MNIMQKIKTNQGFSLIEMMVTIGLIAILILVAIPSYNQFKNKAKEASLKADVSTGYKSYHSYGSVEDTFCASFQTVGLSALLDSELYEGPRVLKSMVGFTATSTQTGYQCSTNEVTFDDVVATTVLQKSSAATFTGAKCTISHDAFTFGAAVLYKDINFGYFIQHNGRIRKSYGNGTATIAEVCQDTT